jgi:hypothetical protein
MAFPTMSQRQGRRLSSATIPAQAGVQCFDVISKKLLLHRYWIPTVRDDRRKDSRIRKPLRA